MPIQAQSATRQALPLILARMTAAVITTVIPLYLARKLSLDEYGTYKQALLLCMPLLGVLPLGVVQSLYFFVPRTEQPRAILLQTQGFNLGMGLIGAVLLWVALPFAAERFPNPALMQLRTELALFVFFSLAGGLFETVLTTQGRTAASASAYVAYELLKSAAMVVPILLGYGLQGAIAALAVVTFVRFVANVGVVVSAPGGRPSWRGLREQLAYALPFGAAMLLNIPQQAAHQYAVSLIATPAVFALYAAGCFQVPLVDLLYSPTSEVLMVRVGQLDKQGRGEKAAALFREATRKLALVFIPSSAFLVIAAPWVVRALFGPRFNAAVPIFRISVLGVMLASLPMDGLLRARGETRHLFFAYLAKAVVTVPLLAVLVPRLGPVGGIVGWLGAEAMGKAMLIVRIPRALAAGGQTPALREWLPVPELVRITAATAACSAGVLLLAPLIDSLSRAERLSAVLQVAVAGSVFAGALLAVMQLLGLRPIAVFTSLRR